MTPYRAHARAEIVLVTLGCALAVFTSVASQAHATATGSAPCDIYAPSCVTVVASGPGGIAHPGASGGAMGSGSGTPIVDVPPPNCSQFPDPYRTYCLHGTGGGTLPNCIPLYTSNRTVLSIDALNALLSANGCPTLAAGAAAPAPPSPATLAQQAAASFLLPLPAGDRSPLTSLTYHGYPLTYINLWTWFWTSPQSWKSFTATASAGGNSATVTATPMALTFDPGDGSSPAVCQGPGRAWSTSDGNGAPTGGGCGFQYTEVSGPGFDHPFTCTQTITWRLTWTGTGNTRGVLTARTTSRSGLLNVLQIQTVDR